MEVREQTSSFSPVFAMFFWIPCNTRKVMVEMYVVP